MDSLQARGLQEDAGVCLLQVDWGGLGHEPGQRTPLVDQLL